jgi:hypothetical protein
MAWPWRRFDAVADDPRRRHIRACCVSGRCLRERRHNRRGQRLGTHRSRAGSWGARLPTQDRESTCGQPRLDLVDDGHRSAQSRRIETVLQLVDERPAGRHSRLHAGQQRCARALSDGAIGIKGFFEPASCDQRQHGDSFLLSYRRCSVAPAQSCAWNFGMARLQTKPPPLRLMVESVKAIH